jgi:predicted RNA-binding protein with PUA-like domain
MAKARQSWLVKSEPRVYSIDDLARDGSTPWEGVRNYQARNFMRDQMAIGDLVLFYHSSADPPGVAGLAKVASKSYPDPTQFDPKSDYFDPRATRADPPWWLIDIALLEKFAVFVPLELLKATPELTGMRVVRRGERLSVQPVEEQHLRRVLTLGGSLPLD